MLTIAKLDRYDMVNSPLGDKPAFTIWFSGCSMRCDGCQNPELWDKDFGDKIDIPELLKIIQHQKMKLNIEDVVLLGGEPLEQLDLPILCKCLADRGYKIWLYTGEEFEDIPDVLKPYLYTIKCGKYKEEYREEGRFPITTNQRVFRNIAGEWKQIDIGGQDNEN